MFLTMVMGGNPTLVSLTNAGFSDEATSPDDASVIARFDTDGNVYNNGSSAQQWLLAGTAAEFEIYVSNAGPDTLASGTLDTWLSLDTDRSFQLQNLGIGSKQAVLTVQIRNAATGDVLDSAVFTLDADVEFGGGG